MDTIKKFRKCNKISQVSLAEYLGVTQGFISQMENGASAIPDSVIRTILVNPYNWDTSMLRDSDQPENPAEAPGTERAALSSAEMLLRDMLTEKEGKIDALNQVIWELKEENGKLKALLGERKRGTAADADFSSAADAV